MEMTTLTTLTELLSFYHDSMARSYQVRSYLDRVHERSKELKHPKPLGFAAEVWLHFSAGLFKALDGERLYMHLTYI